MESRIEELIGITIVCLVILLVMINDRVEGIENKLETMLDNQAAVVENYTENCTENTEEGE